LDVNVSGDKRLERLWIYNNHSQGAYLTRVLFDSEDEDNTTFRKVCKY